MGNVDDASRLKALAVERGLRVRDRISHPTATRFVVALDHGPEPDRLYVHASPNKIAITIDLRDGATEMLSFDEAILRLDPEDAE